MLLQFCLKFGRNNGRNCDWTMDWTMDATVTGARENRRGNGMEVPCKYKLKGPKTFLSQAEYIIRDIAGRRQTYL